jgi:hypothetical protein
MAARFQPMFARHGRPAIVDTDRDAYYYRDYSDIDLAATARWLNERDAGYPGTPALFKSSPTSAVEYHR